MNREQKAVSIRIALSSALTLSVFLAVRFCPITIWWVILLLYFVPYALIGYDIICDALKNIFHGHVFDENFLMTLATVGAFAIANYPEAVMVMLFYQTGELIQSIAVGKSRKSIASLMNIRPDRAVVIRDGNEIELSPEEVDVGETIIVRAGEKIALDGVITKGFTSVDTSALTGESFPRDKGIGDSVVSGSVNLSGLIEIRTSSTYGESTVSKILDLVENSSQKKSRSENFITKFAKYYTPAVVISAVLLALLPPLFIAISDSAVWTEWIKRALVFLVVSCPCALVISVPLSFFGGIGGASRRGILIKGANYLEMLAKVDTVVFDKTGTLTEGSFKVTAVHPKEMSEAELLDIAALAESYSTHPIAESIALAAAHGGHLDLLRVSDIEEAAGYGVSAAVDGKVVYVGNDKLMKKIHADYHQCHLEGTIVHVAYENEYLGHIVISDVLKSDSEEALLRLKKLGVKKTVLLTGDTSKAADSVCKNLPLDEIHAELLPSMKVEEVEKMLSEKKRVAFVGDGINDAPVLMRADIGIAMGAMGSDAAIEAADVVLMDDKPSKVAEAVYISRKTMRLVYENIIFALAVKFVVLALGAFGIADMWLAVFADVGVTVLAVLNAMRALKVNK